MEVKQYTDEKYIALNDLRSFGDEFIKKTLAYRRNFMEMIQINDIDFVNIVETPTLIKKRYEKNVDLKGQVDIKAKHNDFILELAKMIVNDKKNIGIDFNVRVNLLKKYKENNNDLTIITIFLVNNIDKFFLNNNSSKNLKKIFPQISELDEKFVCKYHNINFNYDISDYRKLSKCSYETARKAMDKLANLDFYQKQKVSKKFVYKPTLKLINFLKGSE